MSTISVNLPDAVMSAVAERAQKNEFADVSEYFVTEETIDMLNSTPAQYTSRAPSVMSIPETNDASKDVYEMRSLISRRRFYLKRLKPEPVETN